MKLTIRDLIRLRHCESHYRLGKLGLYAASKRTPVSYTHLTLPTIYTV